uniref:Uncharacterized protein n=1 Tax=Talaromyces marneffei PM1 TaxID=1077442 RepID=A0A093XD50_TALMA
MEIPPDVLTRIYLTLLRNLSTPI